MVTKRNLVFLGAPGAGKGTIAQILSEKEGLVHISTGDIFRNEIKNETELGKKAKHYVTTGGLVPDDLVAEMVASRLSEKDCDSGFILDGFPRTMPQADLFETALDKIGRKIDLVVYFKCDEELLLKRLTARIICKQCGSNFNKLFMPPKKEGVCDKCGGELYQRPDDSLETAKERLAIYNEQTAPLVDYYKKKGLLAEVDGSLGKDSTTPLVLEVVS
jgi:adenylate kinase